MCNGFQVFHLVQRRKRFSLKSFIFRKQCWLYRKFSSGYLHRTYCFIGFFEGVCVCMQRSYVDDDDGGGSASASEARHKHIYMIQHGTSINFEYIEVKKMFHIISAKRSSPFALLGLHTKWPKVKRVGEWVHGTRVIDKRKKKTSTINKKDNLPKKLILKSFLSFSSLLSAQLWIVMRCRFYWKLFHVGSTICGFQTDLLFLFLLLLSAAFSSTKWAEPGKRIHWKHLFK